MLWSIIVGGFIGLAAGAITKKGGSMGVIANIFAGLIGSSVGQSDRKSTRLNSSHIQKSRMPSSA